MEQYKLQVGRPSRTDGGEGALLPEAKQLCASEGGGFWMGRSVSGSAGEGNRLGQVCEGGLESGLEGQPHETPEPRFSFCAKMTGSTVLLAPPGGSEWHEYGGSDRWGRVGSVRQSARVCDPMDCGTPGLLVHHQLSEPAQTHVHRVGDVAGWESLNRN